MLSNREMEKPEPKRTTSRALAPWSPDVYIIRQNLVLHTYYVRMTLKGGSGLPARNSSSLQGGGGLRGINFGPCIYRLTTCQLVKVGSSYDFPGSN